MSQKDLISKHLIKRIFVDVATTLFKLDLTQVELIDTEQQRIEDRRADLCARVQDRDGCRFILHIEIQNQNQLTMPTRMLRYLTDILLNHPDETVEQYLLYIGKAPLSMSDGLTTRQLQYRYHRLDMHEVDYRLLLEQDSPDAVVMAVLGDFHQQDARTVLHEILSKLKRLTQHDNQQLRDCLTMLEILSTNRNLQLDVQQEFEMLEIEIEKLPSFVIGERKGLEQGLERGLEQGLEQGLERGLEQGKALGEHNKACLIAQQLLMLNFPKDQVADITGLAVAELDVLLSSAITPPN